MIDFTYISIQTVEYTQSNIHTVCTNNAVHSRIPCGVYVGIHMVQFAQTMEYTVEYPMEYTLEYTR